MLPAPYGADVIEGEAEPDVPVPNRDDTVDEPVGDADIVEEPDTDTDADADAMIQVRNTVR